LGLLKINLLPKSDPNYEAAEKQADDPNLCLIISHGSPRSVNHKDARGLNTLLKAYGCKPTQPVKINACRAGEGENSIAEQLARLRKGYVIAADAWTWTAPGGITIPFAYPPMSSDPTSPLNSIPNWFAPGNWRTFGPSGPIAPWVDPAAPPANAW
jgi:hypothetical protein